MEKQVKLGFNRTGIATSPQDTQEQLEAAARHLLPPGSPLSVSSWRIEQARAAAPIGSMPPPSTLKGALKSAAKTIMGVKPTLFIDKLGERLAFERTGSRLYEAVIAKLDALGSFDGGPRREDLLEIREDELRHLALIKRAIEELGADPTVQTPSADVVGVASSGLLSVVADARTSLSDALQAALIAELADTASWELLADLASELQENDWAERFREAHRTEESHLARVRHWLTLRVSREAQKDLEPSQPGA